MAKLSKYGKKVIAAADIDDYDKQLGCDDCWLPKLSC